MREHEALRRYATPGLSEGRKRFRAFEIEIEQQDQIEKPVLRRGLGAAIRITPVEARRISERSRITPTAGVVDQHVARAVASLLDDLEELPDIGFVF